MDIHRSRSSPVLVIFDGDDTLWFTERLYDEARASARAIVVRAGTDGNEWEQIQRQVDVENVVVLGYSPERFPTSCVQAYEKLCERHGIDSDSRVISRIRRAAQEVFNRDPELVPRVHDVLYELRNYGIQLALLTKGDIAVQRQRVTASGLEKYFHLVRIVQEKVPATIREVAAELGVSPTNTWMVGNSIRSDVLPALEAGVNVIWVDAHVWEYERAHDHLAEDRVIAVASLAEVPSVIRSSSFDDRPTGARA